MVVSPVKRRKRTEVEMIWKPPRHILSLKLWVWVRPLGEYVGFVLCQLAGEGEPQEVWREIRREKAVICF